MDSLLVPSDEQVERRVASHVVSATIGDKQPNDTLVKPVTFTLPTPDVSKTTNKAKDNKVETCIIYKTSRKEVSRQCLLIIRHWLEKTIS